MKTFLLSEQQRDELIAYLATHPYREVAQGIEKLSRLPEFVPAPDAPPVQEEKKKE